MTSAHRGTDPIARFDLAVVAALFTLYVLGCAPSVDWLDAGSLGAAAWGLGTAHPPGEAGWLAPARLAQLLPVGDLAFRLNLLSAGALALCALPLLALTRALTEPEGRLAPLFAVGVGLLGFGARLQGQRTEVYSLTALLLLLALAAVLLVAGRRGSALLGLLVGTAAAVHPLLVAAAVPALLLGRGLRGRVGLADGALVGGFGLAGFAVMAWLPLRAARVPERTWGIPDTPQRFLDVLLARNFAQNFGESAWGSNALLILELHALSGAIAALLLGFVGWLVLRERGERQEPRRAFLLLLPLWLGGNALTILPQNKVFGTNPDLFGYLLVGALIAAPLGGLGVWALRARARGTRLERMAPLLLGVAAVVLLFEAVDGQRADRSDNTLARQFALGLAQTTPPGSVLVTSGNDSAFVWRWLQEVERRRPELVLVHRVLVGHPHEELRLAPALARLDLRWRKDLREQPLLQLSQARVPSYIEIRDPELADRGKGLSPHGLVWAVRGPRRRGDGREPQESGELRALRERTLAALRSEPWDDEAHLVGAMLESTGEGGR